MARPAPGPSAIEMATARFSSMTADPVSPASRPYRSAMRAQSVADATGAWSCWRAMAACSV